MVDLSAAVYCHNVVFVALFFGIILSTHLPILMNFYGSVFLPDFQLQPREGVSFQQCVSCPVLIFILFSCAALTSTF